jgi:hypothetical protein
MNGDQILLDALLSGKAPRNARLAAAKALIPLALPEQLSVLIRLTADPDKIVNLEANSTLEAIPEERILLVLRSEETNPETLDYFAFDPTRSSLIPQAVAMNNATADNTIAELAQVADSALLEMILLNQTRLIRHPPIMDAFLANAAATPEITRRVSEIKTEFFIKPGRTPSVAVPAIITPGVGPESVVLDASLPRPADETVEVEVPFRPEELGLQTKQEISTFQRIALMTTSGKVKLALLGNREERAILIRDSNRVVTSSVLKSPKISVQEVEAISQMRNVSEEVLRLIGNRREWVKSYVVVRSLVRNPKTPVALSLRLLPRLLESDIRLLARDKSIPEMIRRTAGRALQDKSSSH